MSGRVFYIVVMVGVGILGVQGCSHCFRRSSPPPLPPPPPPSNGAFYPAPGLLTPHPLQPYQVAPAGPPSTGVLVPPAGLQAPLAPAPVPPQPPVDVRRYGPTASLPESCWHPPTSVSGRLAEPEAASPEPPRESARLYPPVVTEEPPLAPGTPGGTKPAKPQVTEGAGTPPPMPAGIPQFSSAQEGVTAGLKPSSFDGLDWLQANRYRAVLHIKLPGEDDAADRQVIEKRNLQYLSLDASPKTLSRAAVDEFTQIVDDPKNHPLFVYDKDGILAGGLWYLHFRLANGDSDEVARLKAARLGLKEPNADNRTMWLAIEKFIAEQKRQ